MTTKTFRLGSLNLSLLRQAVSPMLTLVVVISPILLLVSGCMGLFRPTSPVLYKPSCDIRPVLTLRLPEQIDTLAGVPRTKTRFEGGTNIFGGQLPDDIKEEIYLKTGATEYTFIVFFSESAANKWYESETKRHPVYRENTENGLTGRVHYTEEPRADPEGGSVPMGYYVSRADFRLHNLYIRVETTARRRNGEKPHNDKLADAVKDLAQMLEANLKPPTNEPP